MRSTSTSLMTYYTVCNIEISTDFYFSPVFIVAQKRAQQETIYRIAFAISQYYMRHETGHASTNSLASALTCFKVQALYHIALCDTTGRDDLRDSPRRLLSRCFGAPC